MLKRSKTKKKKERKEIITNNNKDYIFTAHKWKKPKPQKPKVEAMKNRRIKTPNWEFWWCWSEYWRFAAARREAQRSGSINPIEDGMNLINRIFFDPLLILSALFFFPSDFSSFLWLSDLCCCCWLFCFFTCWVFDDQVMKSQETNSWLKEETDRGKWGFYWRRRYVAIHG